MKTVIKFIYEVEQSPTLESCSSVPRKLEIVLSGDVNLTELIEQFELFTKGIGYFPPENAHLDYVDNDTEKPKSLE
jgi:hypothetical protein